MPKYRVMVWKDYTVSETYYKTVEADNEEEAAELAEDAIRNEDYDSHLGDSECFDVKIQANEGSITPVEDDDD